jgi:superfamily II DNA/RNA helicase
VPSDEIPASSQSSTLPDINPRQGLYTEMGFDRPSCIQAATLPLILTPDPQGVYRDLIAQVGECMSAERTAGRVCVHIHVGYCRDGRAFPMLPLGAVLKFYSHHDTCTPQAQSGSGKTTCFALAMLSRFGDRAQCQPFSKSLRPVVCMHGGASKGHA